MRFGSYLLFAQETTSQILGNSNRRQNGFAGATVIALHIPSGPAIQQQLVKTAGLTWQMFESGVHIQ